MARKPRIRKTAEQMIAEAMAKRAQDLEAVNLQPDAANLPRQADIEVTRKGQSRDGRKVEGEQARRLDAFAALREGMADGAYDAARRLEADYLIRMGGGDHGRPMERVDNDQGRCRTDQVIAAAERIEAVTDLISPRDRLLFVELIWPPITRGTWRDHVEFLTGEANPHAQCAVVRAACVNLRDAYTALERRAAA